VAGFIRDFLHACGTSEVPRAFQRWAAIATVAAVLRDRVWMPKGGGTLKPNLYIFLVGPSGIGKGEAIASSLRLLKDFAQVPTLYGRLTAAAMIDMLAHSSSRPNRYSKLFLATPELAMAVGRGPQADDLIKLMTELYGGADYAPLVERTRTSGRHLVIGHCLNWLAGTTREWLRDCVTREAVEGGFFARVACIQADYQLHRRVPSPIKPADYDATMERLHEHIESLLALEGEITMDAQAEAVHRDWYVTRPEPLTESLLPSWKREDDLARKLAMVLAMSEPMPQRVITAKHAVAAQQLVAETAKQLPAIIEYIGADMESDAMRRIRQVIREAGTISHTAIAETMARFGVTHDRLRVFMDTLIDAGMVHRVRHPRVGPVYQWRTRTHRMEDTDGIS
jgi:hypothetical protein